MISSLGRQAGRRYGLGWLGGAATAMTQWFRVLGTTAAPVTPTPPVTRTIFVPYITRGLVVPFEDRTMRVPIQRRRTNDGI